jgi:YHS domain-containing protein
MKNKLLLLLASLCALFSCAQDAKEKSARVNLKNGIAIQGYDPVAYFEKKEAIKGNKEITATNDGSTYYFSSEENKTLFLENPSKFQPQYGGYCSYGMSEGYKAPVDPTAFTIVEDKLYLNYSHKVKQEWTKNRATRIEKANEHWEKKK